MYERVLKVIGRELQRLRSVPTVQSLNSLLPRGASYKHIIDLLILVPKQMRKTYSEMNAPGLLDDLVHLPRDDLEVRLAPVDVRLEVVQHLVLRGDLVVNAATQLAGSC